MRLDIDPSDVTLNCPSSNGFPRFSTNASLGLSVSVVVSVAHVFYPPVPNVVLSLCMNSDVLVDGLSMQALGDGTYRVDYSATKATTYRLVGTVNGQFIGFSTQCPTLTGKESTLVCIL